MENSAFEHYFENLRGKRLAVLGLGVSNRPLAKLLLAHGCQVIGCDRTPREWADQAVLELERDGAVLRLGPDYLEDLQADVAFRTPGMHPNMPALVRLRQTGAEITSEMEAFFELCPCQIIGVTGSDGKTTTTTLIAEMLREAGYRIWLGGNIGQPLLSLIPQMKPDHYAVVELSSFQLMDMRRSPHIAVVTNLAPNHLDVHRDMQEYIQAKQNVYRYQSGSDLLIVNMDNPITRDFVGPGALRKFSRLCRPEAGVFLENGGVYRCGTQGQNALILLQQEILLPGIHNVENYMAAIAAVEGLVPDVAIRKVAAHFAGVEHRIELVREKDGVRYYNDSIASSPSRTIAGLRSFPQKVVLIAGGYDKHIPYDALGPEICRHVKLLIVTGDTGEKIWQATVQAPTYQPGKPDIQSVPEFAQAVLTAAQAARPGDVVLLSPASAAFDRFPNFMVRGQYFKELVQSL